MSFVYEKGKIYSFPIILVAKYWSPVRALSARRARNDRPNEPVQRVPASLGLVPGDQPPGQHLAQNTGGGAGGRGTGVRAI